MKSPTITLSGQFLPSFQYLESTIADRKKILEPYYTDKSFSLEDRWELFCSVPVALQESHNWVMNFPEWESKHGDIDWNTGRGGMVDLVGFVEEMCEDLEDDVVDEFKEVVLAKGYHTFTFDW